MSPSLLTSRRAGFDNQGTLNYFPADLEHLTGQSCTQDHPGPSECQLCRKSRRERSHLSICIEEPCSARNSHSYSSTEGVNLRTIFTPTSKTSKSSICPITGMKLGISWIGLNMYAIAQLAAIFAGQGTSGRLRRIESSRTCLLMKTMSRRNRDLCAAHQELHELIFVPYC